MSWLDRSALAGHCARENASDRKGEGEWLVGAVPGEGFVSLGREAREFLRDRSSAVLAAAGVEQGQRVLVSINGEGDLAGPRIGEAAIALGARTAVVGPRGRMRTLAALRTLRPQVWITTPTGALDFLARLYLEFNVDPLDLALERILVVGEIPTPGTSRRLADEFESAVVGLYGDPVFGGLWSHAEETVWKIDDSGVLAFGELGRDVLVEDGVDRGESADSSSPGAALRELVLRPCWSGPLRGTTIRTGEVVTREVADAAIGSLFRHTVGEHLLVRGRWLSLPELRRALSSIDGLAAHRVEIARGEGTLDQLTFTLAFARASLVENPMWAARAREAIASITPVDFVLATELAGDGSAGLQIVDRRGHHLGVDRRRLGEPRST